VWEWLFSVCCAHSCQALPRWSELTNNTLQNNGVHFFTLKFEYHNTYNKLLLCNSANGDVARCKKNNSESSFGVFYMKKNKNLFRFEKTKKN